MSRIWYEPSIISTGLPSLRKNEARCFSVDILYGFDRCVGRTLPSGIISGSSGTFRSPACLSIVIAILSVRYIHPLHLEPRGVSGAVSERPAYSITLASCLILFCFFFFGMRRWLDLSGGGEPLSHPEEQGEEGRSQGAPAGRPSGQRLPMNAPCSSSQAEEMDGEHGEGTERMGVPLFPCCCMHVSPNNPRMLRRYRTAVPYQQGGLGDTYIPLDPHRQ